MSGLVYSLDISSSCINVMTYARLSVLQCRSFIADILVVTAVPAKRLGLCVNQADVHDLSQVVVSLAQICEQLRIAVFLCILLNFKCVLGMEKWQVLCGSCLFTVVKYICSVYEKIRYINNYFVVYSGF